MWFPCQVDVAQGSQSGKLHRMAVDHDEQCDKILSRDHQNSQRTLKPNEKNVRSTKPALLPLKISDETTLRGKKQRDVFTKVYDVREKNRIKPENSPKSPNEATNISWLWLKSIATPSSLNH